MAKFELKFIDVNKEDISIKTYFIDNYIKIGISYGSQKATQSIYLDKSTAIKFAKTLRTEINKIDESEVSNE